MESNIVKARSSIVFIIALFVAFSSVWLIEKKVAAIKINAQAVALITQRNATLNASQKMESLRPVKLEMSTDIPVMQVPRVLTTQEVQWARIAWQYFKNNTDEKTGMVNSVDKYHATTMWDTASYLLALISARNLKIITSKDFDSRLNKILYSLGRIELFDNSLPNKSYNTATLAMVDYRNNVTKTGIGWSAIDLGRLLIPLNVISWNYPQHTHAVHKVIARWNMTRLTNNGQLFGAKIEEGKLQLVQEGRLGYEQYTAKNLSLIGLDVSQAFDYYRYLQQTEIYGIFVPYDQRDAKSLGAHNYVLSEPYVLDGLEFGWDHVSREFAWRIYRVQEERFRRTGVLTAVSEDHVDQSPYFVYNTIFTNGKSWNTLTEKGEDASVLRSLSVKAAFGWHALYRSEYTSKLVQEISSLYNPSSGWYSGIYEDGKIPNKSINANTNAVILESLGYIAHGKLLSYQ